MKEKEDKARTIIKELDGGLAFDEAAKKYSDDFSKRKGGDIGFVLEGMRGQDFSKAVFAVKSGHIRRSRSGSVMPSTSSRPKKR